MANNADVNCGALLATKNAATDTTANKAINATNITVILFIGKSLKVTFSRAVNKYAIEANIADILNATAAIITLIVTIFLSKATFPNPAITATNIVRTVITASTTARKVNAFLLRSFTSTVLTIFNAAATISIDNPSDNITPFMAFIACTAPVITASAVRKLSTFGIITFVKNIINAVNASNAPIIDEMTPNAAHTLPAPNDSRSFKITYIAPTIDSINNDIDKKMSAI